MKFKKYDYPIMINVNPIPKRVKKFSFFIGIDISKNKLDFAVFNEKTFLFHSEIKNDHEAILLFVSQLKGIFAFKLSRAIFCMENTGFYGNHLLNTLTKLKASIVQEHPLKIKKSMGLSRGKDDKTDAIRIADYAWKNRTELNFWIPRRQIINELAELIKLRSRLLGVYLILKTPQKEKKAFTNSKTHKKVDVICNDSIMSIETDILKVELEIKSLITADEYLTRLMQIITSVPFVGFVTAVNIIICTNEYKDITDPKKFACYAGIAPFPNESGLIVRKRHVSSIANKNMKALIHLCAVGAATRKGELNGYYLRKLKEGKQKVSIINAVRNKLVLRVFACLKQDRLYIKEYQPKELISEINNFNKEC